MEIVTIIHYVIYFILIIWFISLFRPIKKSDSTVTSNSAIPVLSIECVDNVILVYNTKTNEFVCQGNNLNDLENNLKISKISKAVLIPHNASIHKECYWFLNGKLENESKYR
jgi:hypothetical protein